MECCSPQDKEYLLAALNKAKESVAKGGFPAGAVIVQNDKIISSSVSIGNLMNDPTCHAEMASIRQACSDLKTTNLSDATLYASMQPCIMCLGAAMWSGVERVVFACSMDKVNPEYYGGDYCSHGINERFLRPLFLEHCAELEGAALKVIQEWERRGA